MNNGNSALRVAHLADTHLGYFAYGKSDPASGRNQRAVDIEASFTAAISDILTRDVDLVVHAGDAFHHTRPSWSTLAHFIRQMRRLEDAGIPTVVIAGNHDTPRLRTSGSVYNVLALALPNVRFMAGYEVEQETYPALDLTVTGVPHGALANPEPLMVVPDLRRRNIVIAHGVVPGYVFAAGHEPGEVAIDPNVIALEHDYIALGHVHLRDKVHSNTYYSGSTERTSWGDQPVQPGYALVTLGAKGDVPQVEYIDVPARPMESLTPIDGGDKTARELAEMILARAGALGKPDAMVRVELRETPRPLFRETDAIVRREIGDNAWHIRLTAPGEALDLLGRDGVAGIGDLHPVTLFESFVQEKIKNGDYDATFAETFRTRGSQALERAIARLQDDSASEGAAG